MSEFWLGLYSLGAISPRKEQILAKFHISNLQNYKFERYSDTHQGATHSTGNVQRYTLCYWVQEL